MDARPAVLALLTLVLGGCGTPPATQPFAASERPGFESRGLSDPGLVMFLGANPGMGQPPWDFETLSWVAFYYHPSLEIARAQWEEAQAARLTAQARVNPTLSVTPGFDSSRQAGVSPWFPAINLDFLLQRADRRRHQRDVARAESEAARLAVLASAWIVRSELRTALTEAWAAEQRATSLRAQAGVQRELLSLLQRRQAAGSASAGDVSTLRLALLRAEAAMGEAAGKQAAARARVAAALGVPLTALEGVILPRPPQAQAMDAAALAQARRDSLRSRADLLSALAKIDAAESAIALETSRRLPDFHVGPGYQYDQGANKWSVALSLELPLFNRNEGPIAEAVAKRNEAVARLISAQAQVIAALDSAMVMQSAAADQLARAQGLRAEASHMEVLAQQRFVLGAADQVERVTAHLELVLAESAVSEAEVAFAVASGQMEDALQLPFTHFENLGKASPAPNLKAP